MLCLTTVMSFCLAWESTAPLAGLTLNPTIFAPMEMALSMSEVVMAPKPAWIGFTDTISLLSAAADAAIASAEHCSVN